MQDDKSADQDGGDQENGKPQVDENAKQAAAEMMQAYEERPTVVLPGSGGTITGTAVNDWLDDNGDPQYNDEVGGDVGRDDGDSDEEARREQIEQDKARNEELREAAAEENKGEKA